VRAAARVVAGPDGSGGTRLTTLYGEPPLLPRRTGPAGGAARVHLVGGAAGPLGGDDLTLEIEVGPGAQLRVASVAASVALPGPAGAPSRTRVRATVAAGGSLCWLPEPLVAAARCRHTADVQVELAEGASLVWRDELVCGRYGERPGDVRLTASVRYGGRPLYRNDLAAGPSAPGWDGPAVLGGAGAVGTLLVVRPEWGDHPPPGRVLGRTAAVLPLTGPAQLTSATGADALEVRRLLAAGPPAAGRTEEQEHRHGAGQREHGAGQVGAAVPGTGADQRHVGGHRDRSPDVGGRLEDA
jgi:urease accessory protein